MHRIRRVTSAAIVVLAALQGTVASATVDRDARLLLDAGRYRLVEPYRYVEARRFEAGWNRGADVAPVGGVVVAPVSGRVRHAAALFGRGVVTIESRVGGVPVVVTLTGLHEITVERGMQVTQGARLGSGRLVHVGAYDRARRTRYLPVHVPRVQVHAPTGAQAVASDLPAGGRSLSGSLVDRLARAIAGDHLQPDQALAVAVPGSARPATHRGQPDRIGYGDASERVVEQQAVAGSQPSAARVGHAAIVAVAAAGAPAAERSAAGRLLDGAGATGRPDAASALAAPGIHMTDVAMPDARRGLGAMARAGGSAGGRERGARASVDPGPFPPVPGLLVDEPVALVASPPLGPRPHVVRIERHEASELEGVVGRAATDGHDERRRSSRWQLALPALVVVVATLARRRIHRRRRPSLPPAALHRPLPLVLPARPRAPRIAAARHGHAPPDFPHDAWRDLESGTSVDTARRPAARSPEHA